MRPARWLSALILLLILAAPASAGHGGIHPTFSTRTVYFHCTGDTPIQQVNWLSSNGSSTSYATWDGSPPAGSVTTGEGCGAGDMGGASFEFFDPVFEGMFIGNLRDLTVRLYDFVLNSERDANTPVRLRVYAEVDGIPIFPGGTAEEGGYAGRSFTVQPTRENSGLTDRFEFTITNVGFAKEIRDEAGNVVDVQTGGAVKENGAGVMEHTLKLLVGLDGFAGEEPQVSGAELFVWDTTEVPSGITFNPPTPAAATVTADLPQLG
jgi:hypothetical protein